MTSLAAESDFFQSAQSKLEGFIESKTLGAFVFPLIAYVAARALLTWTAEIHWLLGTIVAAIVACVIIMATIGLRDAFFTREGTPIVLSMFATLVLLGTAVCSFASYTLWAHGLASYASDKSPLNMGVFGDYYLYYFVSMIPGLNVWETLNVASPMRPQGHLAGLPLLAFRLMVALPILQLFNDWRKFRGKSDEAKGAEM